MQVSVKEVLAIVAAANIVMASVKTGLDAIQGQFAIAQKADSFLAKVTGLIGKILDFVGYNPEHP